MWFKEKFENHVREGGAIILWWVVEHGYLGKKREREKYELATHNMQACTDTLTLFCPFLCRSSVLRWLLSVCVCFSFPIYKLSSIYVYHEYEFHLGQLLLLRPSIAMNTYNSKNFSSCPSCFRILFQKMDLFNMCLRLWSHFLGKTKKTRMAAQC